MEAWDVCQLMPDGVAAHPENVFFLALQLQLLKISLMSFFAGLVSYCCRRRT